VAFYDPLMLALLLVFTAYEERALLLFAHARARTRVYCGCNNNMALGKVTMAIVLAAGILDITALYDS